MTPNDPFHIDALDAANFEEPPAEPRYWSPVELAQAIEELKVAQSIVAFQNVPVIYTQQLIYWLQYLQLQKMPKQ